MSTQSLHASLPPIARCLPDERVFAEPVWRYINDALSISFQMEMIEMSQPSPTLVVIKDMMEQRYGLAPTLRSESRVNMGTLRPIDLRAQCASVRRVVEQPDNKAGISDVQRCAVLARFSYQVKRAHAVAGLQEHFNSLCNSPNKSAVRALIWGIYEVRSKSKVVKSVRGDWSTRAIEKDYGVTRATLERDRRLMRDQLFKIEDRALNVLEDYFKRTGLVGEFD